YSVTVHGCRFTVHSFLKNPVASKLQGMFCLTAVLRSDRKEVSHFYIRSLLRFNGELRNVGN
ncbi:MAG: hypothetical protein QME06_01460, partial [Desulfobacterales bacterium]|nr:hypothetical protein [Desulfobacterales bacterium]